MEGIAVALTDAHGCPYRRGMETPIILTATQQWYLQLALHDAAGLYRDLGKTEQETTARELEAQVKAAHQVRFES